MHSDYINYLADQPAKHGLKAKIDDCGQLDITGKLNIANERQANLGF